VKVARPRRAISRSESLQDLMATMLKYPTTLQQTLTLLTNLFPVWVILFVCVGMVRPELVTWIHGDGITFLVAATMVFTGMTLNIEDFVQVLKNPGQVSMGCICQYTLMPFLAYLISRLLKLPADIAAGLILLGSCPGGTSSNLITLIARGDVALSVLMTTGSTLLAPLATPTLVSMLAGNLVRIDGVGLVVSTFQVVLGPVAMGLLIHHLIPGLAEKAKTFTPLISVLIVSLICGSIVGQTASTALIAGPVVLLAVFLLHSLGFVLGFMVPKLFGYPCRVSRTTSIEVGIQSSALAVVLATRHFPNPVLSALPCAISATVQSMLGSAVAIYWNRMPLTDEPQKKAAGRPWLHRLRKSWSSKPANVGGAAGDAGKAGETKH